MNETLQKLLTGKDNATPDLGRWSWAASLASVFAGGAWNAIHNQALDLMAFAQAIGVVVAAHGGAIWAKAKTEPVEK